MIRCLVPSMTKIIDFKIPTCLPNTLIRCFFLVAPQNVKLFSLLLLNESADIVLVCENSIFPSMICCQMPVLNHPLLLAFCDTNIKSKNSYFLMEDTNKDL